jgi:hypothetical protein
MYRKESVNSSTLCSLEPGGIAASGRGDCMELIRSMPYLCCQICIVCWIGNRQIMLAVCRRPQNSIARNCSELEGQSIHRMAGYQLAGCYMYRSLQLLACLMSIVLCGGIGDKSCEQCKLYML